MIKPLWILLLGSTPLAVLTVSSFVGLRAIDAGASGPGEADTQAAVSLLEAGVTRVGTDRSLSGRVAAIDLLSGETAPELEKARADSIFKPLAAEWPRWTAVRRLVDELLAIERLIARDDVESLKTAAQQIKDLRDKVASADLRGAGPLLGLLNQRAADIRQKIALRETESTAARLLAEAKEAFQSRRYEQAKALCGQWLTRYENSMDSTMVEQVKTLRRRSEFQAERELASTRLKAARTLADRESVLGSFLQQFRADDQWTDEERTIIERCREGLESVRTQKRAQRAFQEAQEDLEKLRARLPDRLDDRVTRAAAIFERHPEERVKTALRDEIPRWIEELVPEKALSEDPLLEEAESTTHEILRGYFRAVDMPGSGTGYKRYATAQQRRNPVADVGTIPGRQVIEKPGPSLLRRSVVQYNEARGRVLSDPGRKQGWVELAALCEALESQVQQYRPKSGASQEALSFAAEAKTIRDLLAGEGWNNMETLWKQ